MLFLGVSKIGRSFNTYVQRALHEIPRTPIVGSFLLMPGHFVKPMGAVSWPGSLTQGPTEYQTNPERGTPPRHTTHIVMKNVITTTKCYHVIVRSSPNNNVIDTQEHVWTWPLGQPWSVYKSDDECRFFKFWVEMAKWRWRSMTPIFKTGWENPDLHIWCKFGDSSSYPLQVIAWASYIFKNSESKWP